MKSNLIFLNITTNYPPTVYCGEHQNGVYDTRVQGTWSKHHCINSNTKEDKDETGMSEKGIEYITFNSHKRFNFFSNIKQSYKLLKFKKADGHNVVILTTNL
jgi:hypothetical protein